MNQFSHERVNGFLHTEGRKMVNGNGEKVILRGWALGGWLNPEGYMNGGVPLFVEVGKFTDFALPRRFERGRTVEATVRELCGTEYAKHFVREWRNNYITEDDIRAIAEMGYNSIRLPVSARLLLKEEPGIEWVEETFELLERVFDWCENYRMYVVVDMHGAPGGQSALACDDGLDNRPHTFMEPESRERSILIWEELAKRYHDRWIIGGWDLLNEPLSGPDCRKYLPELVKFYDEAVERIRKYDVHHMVTLEGSIFAMDMDIFDHDYDPQYHNWCIHIHYYDFSPEARTLYRYLDRSIACNVPIWIGEGGSNPVSNSIFYEIAATYDIGYCLFTWKIADDPLEHARGAARYPLPKEWERIRGFIRRGEARPSYAESQRIMDEYLENLKLCRCRIDRQHNQYDLRQPGISLPAVGFDQGSAVGTGWAYGNAFAYRTEEDMKMPLRPGIMPQQIEIVPTGETLRPASPLTDLCLELRKNERVSYTIRDVKERCFVQMDGRGYENAELEITCRHDEKMSDKTNLIRVPGKANHQQLALLERGEEWTVIIKVLAGYVQLDEIHFAVEAE